MTAPDFTRKTDAELMRFCAVTSGTLTDLSRRIAASKAARTGMEAAFDTHAEHLSAAIAELERRFPDQPGDDDEDERTAT